MRARTGDSALAGCTIIVAADRRAADLTTALERRGAVVRRARPPSGVAGAGGEDPLAEVRTRALPHTVQRRGRRADLDVVRRSALQAASGEADAVLFTSAPEAASWIAVADDVGALDGIRRRSNAGRLLIASAGPSTAAPLEAADVRTTIAGLDDPDSLARTVIAHFGGGGAPSLPTGPGRVEVRSGGVIVDGEFVPLSRSAAALLEALASAGGRVLSRAELGGVLPGAERKAHAVEVAVARLREALGGRELVHTVVKRGYRLAVTED